MGNSRTNESVTEIIPKVLGQYLLETVEDLEEFYDEFPNHNQRMDMPSVSIFAKAPAFKPMAAPYLLNPIQDEEIENSKADTLWVVGDYDFDIQLDLWAGSKEELDDVSDALFNALNPTIKPMGLVLPMEEYYGILCSYLYTGHNREASSITAQTDEWRITFNIVVTCQAIRNSKDFIIESTELIDEIHTKVLIT